MYSLTASYRLTIVWVFDRWFMKNCIVGLFALDLVRPFNAAAAKHVMGIDCLRLSKTIVSGSIFE